MKRAMFGAVVLVLLASTAVLAAARAAASATNINQPIYAESGVVSWWAGSSGPSDLYLVSPPASGSDTLIGTIQTADGSQPVITDIALSPSGSLYGCSFDTLYLIDQSTAIATPIGSGLPSTNALAFDASGQLFGATTSGAFLQIDTNTGGATTVGYYGSGYVASGDLAFAPDGTLYATVTAPGVANDVLVTVDPATGTATRVDPNSDIGWADVYGLAFDGTQLLGLTAASPGALIEINTQTGNGTFIRNLTFCAFGATTAPYIATPTSVNVSANPVTPNIGEAVTFKGTVEDQLGNGVSSIQVGIDDPIEGISTTTATDGSGYFTYSVTPSEPGSFLFSFYVGSVTTTCILNVGMKMNVTFSSFPELNLYNGTAATTVAELYVNGALEGNVTINPGQSQQVISVARFDPGITAAVETCPVDLGAASGCIDSSGTISVTVGEALQVGGYANLEGSTFGACVGVGGDLPYLVEGSGAICVGTDGINLVGSAGPGIVHGTITIHIVSFDQPSLSVSAHSPINSALD